MNILLVDDDTELTALLTRYLERELFKVTSKCRCAQSIVLGQRSGHYVWLRCTDSPVALAILLRYRGWRSSFFGRFGCIYWFAHTTLIETFIGLQ